MLVDARQLEQDTLVEADICIVGAGAVGIAMGVALNSSSQKVVILESGGLLYDEKTQSLYEGDNIGRKNYPIGRNRLRYFGGTTGHWAGHCRPFDAFDFSKRDWIPHSGWPLEIEELEPYLEKAQPLLGLGKYDYDSLQEYAKQLDLDLLPLDERFLVNVMKHQSPPTRFGPEYKEVLERSKNVHVYLYSNVLRLNSNANANHIENIDVRCIEGPTYQVKAKRYVLATGGLENARLMLLSDTVSPQGVGNSNGLVGRYYTDHILVRPALDISLSGTRRDISFYTNTFGHDINGGKVFAILTASEELTRREQLTRFRFHLYNNSPTYGDAIGGVFSYLDGADEAASLSRERGNSIAVHMAMEPIPNPDLFVRLSNKTDFLGQRKIEVNWQVSDQELRNAHRAIEICALEFARMGVGRAYAPILENPKEWPKAFQPGKHHCGTTRMSHSPETGVVDSNCKAFDLDNLFLTGSSVFPTISHTNPTLNLLALALRLVDHLKEQAQRE